MPKNIHNPAKDTPGTIDAQGHIKITWVKDGGWVVGYECGSKRLKKLEERVVPNFIDFDLEVAVKKMFAWLDANNIEKF